MRLRWLGIPWSLWVTIFPLSSTGLPYKKTNDTNVLQRRALGEPVPHGLHNLEDTLPFTPDTVWTSLGRESKKGFAAYKEDLEKGLNDLAETQKRLEANPVYQYLSKPVMTEPADPMAEIKTEDIEDYTKISAQYKQAYSLVNPEPKPVKFKKPRTWLNKARIFRLWASDLAERLWNRKPGTRKELWSKRSKAEQFSASLAKFDDGSLHIYIATRHVRDWMRLVTKARGLEDELMEKESVQAQMRQSLGIAKKGERDYRQKEPVFSQDGIEQMSKKGMTVSQIYDNIHQKLESYRETISTTDYTKAMQAHKDNIENLNKEFEAQATHITATQEAIEKLNKLTQSKMKVAEAALRDADSEKPDKISALHLDQLKFSLKQRLIADVARVRRDDAALQDLEEKGWSIRTEVETLIKTKSKNVNRIQDVARDLDTISQYQMPLYIHRMNRMNDLSHSFMAKVWNFIESKSGQLEGGGWFDERRGLIEKTIEKHNEEYDKELDWSLVNRTQFSKLQYDAENKDGEKRTESHGIRTDLFARSLAQPLASRMMGGN